MTDSTKPAKPSAKRSVSRVRQPLSDKRSHAGLQGSRTPEYLVIGHICADLHTEGHVVLGGTALYSALTAARLGWRTAVLTRGIFGREVHGHMVPSLEPFADELDIIVQEAGSTTMFVNTYNAGRRTQMLPHWAEPIDLRGLPPHWRNAKIIHLGPIAQEIDPRQTGGLTPEFLGATPQGWMRNWPRPGGGRVTTSHLRLPASLVGSLDGIVVSDEEISDCRDTVDAVGSRRLGAVTMGDNGSRIIYGGTTDYVAAYKVDVADATGAGDTYAASFFIKATDRSVSAVKAAQFASAVSALSLTGVGVDGIPTAAQIDEFLKTAQEYPIRR
ncbi:MAG: carbohydrate kinase [Thermomicrobiales bacterium]|nr:carbohydrate kinase [Thermomicrobiales bacterium]